jgi:hypothetical protein
MTEWLPAIERMLTLVVALVAAGVSVQNSRRIKEVHISLNSRLDQMLALKGEASEAKGAANERANPLVSKN